MTEKGGAGEAGAKRRRFQALVMDRHFAEHVRYLWNALRAALAIHRSGMFDPAWYGGSGARKGTARLLMNYVLRGAAEGRSPSAEFDGDWYLRTYPEVGMAGLNPLAHFVTRGRLEGYAIRPARAGLARQPLSGTAYAGFAAELARLALPELERRARSGGEIAPVAVVETGGRLVGGADHVLLLPEGVRMLDGARLVLALAVRASPGTDLFFADEEHAGGAGVQEVPWFKPGFDPELMVCGDLTGPAAVCRRAALERLGWDGVGPDAHGLRSLALRAWQQGCQVGHIPMPLFRRPEMPRLMPVSHVPPVPAPMVSVIIATRDRAALLENSVNGVLNATTYKPLELLIVDNGSRDRAALGLLGRLSEDARVRVLAAPGPFNWSALNNQAARVAGGEVLVLLNNDVEVISPDWLSVLVAQAMRPGVGAAGARLLYPDGTIQHAGLTLDSAGCYRHMMRGAPADESGPAGEFAVTRSVAAVTGACLAIRRDIFFAVGGLEETALAVTTNDIDLCLRVRAAGHRVVYAPASVLVHHEAASRGHDAGPAQRARVLAERDFLRSRWGEMAMRDPYMNPNLCLLFDRLALDAPSQVVEKPEFWAFLAEGGN